MYERIACLTEETTEALYLMEEDWRIVGISGYTVRPPRARQEKPRISAFTKANIGAIQELRPDLVLAFSDIQADIAAELVRKGIEVHVFNQRSVAEILRTVRSLGGMIGRAEKGEALATRLEQHLDEVRERAAAFPRRPRVYFEEWNDPMISGIRWVSELITAAGGVDCFEELSAHSLAKDRIIEDPAEVVRRAPDLMLASWCGRKFQKDQVLARKGWHEVPAIRDDAIHEIPSALILQPGPAALTDGVDAIQQHLQSWNGARA